MLKIAVSARIHWGTPKQTGISQKDGYFIEHSVAHMLSRHGALALTVPPLRDTQNFAQDEAHQTTLADYAALCDGLVLQGGADLSPENYGESARNPDWQGDAGRDAYELALVDAFCAAGKPILGICRGMQVLNVYFGGSLYQDIATDIDTGVVHRDRVNYEKPIHAISIVAGSALAKIYGDQSPRNVNSIHHQCVKQLGRDLIVEATAEDGIIEAVCHGVRPIRGVQWHPEFHDPAAQDRLPSAPLILDFLRACRNEGTG